MCIRGRLFVFTRRESARYCRFVQISCDFACISDHVYGYSLGVGENSCVLRLSKCKQKCTKSEKMTRKLTTGERHVAGTIKWFDPSKGYGFVIAHEGGQDILLHANVLRNFGQSSVADGVEIELLVQDTDRGSQAIEVLSLAPPKIDEPVGLADIEGLEQTDLDQMPLVPARVKWFDKAKGFGFANAFGKSDDVFVHIEVLRRSGLADLQPGEAICMRILDGQRGRMAAAVHSWETASFG